MKIVDRLKQINWLDGLALLTGLLFPLAFDPVGWYWLAWLLPISLYYCWHHVTPKRAMWRGWVFGLGYFGVGVSWVYISIHVFGNTPALLAGFITALFVMTIALFFLLQGYLYAKLFPRDSLIKWLIAFPVLWALVEWFRSWFLTGFPWELIGYTQTNSPLRGLIPIIGGFGTAFVVMLISGLLFVWLKNIFRFIKTRQNQCGMYWPVAAVLIVIFAIIPLRNIQWTHPQGKPVQVSLVQGNIPQNLKWLPTHIIPTLKLYYDLTKQHWDSRIIVWPEAAIPIPKANAQVYIDRLGQRALAHNAAVITGVPIQKPGYFAFYNALISIGRGHGVYEKRHLVPFGEFIPFERYLRGLIGFLQLPMSNMTPGPFTQSDIYADGIKIAPFICYEIAYADDLYLELPQANLLVTVSDDSWFGHSFAQAQHLQIGMFRAIQGGRQLLFSTNNGITAIVNQQGQIVKRAPSFETTVLTGDVQPLSGATPWVRIGNVPIILVLWVMLIVAFFL